MDEREKIMGILSRLLEKGGSAVEGAIELDLIEHGGSERMFYRVRIDRKDLVLMVHEGRTEELLSYIDVDRFLAGNGIPVPEIISSSEDDMAVLMEDLGDTHLEDLLLAGGPEDVEDYYRRCLDILITLQTKVTKAMQEERFLEGKIFSRQELLGETDYFLEEFVKGYCKIKLGTGIRAEIDKEREMLAETLSRENLVFMHRDFQSRNIMIKEGKFYLVDFQSAHRGPWPYDTASLLKDAYFTLDEHIRHELLEDLFQELKEQGVVEKRSFEDLYHTFTLAGIQRNMQALAAFAKLGERVGKREFLKSIPPALKLLEEGLSECSELKYHRELVKSIMDKLGT